MNEKGVGECLSGERSSARKANGIERTDKERVRRTKKWKRKWRSSGRISEEERKNSVKDWEVWMKNNLVKEWMTKKNANERI